MKTATVRDLRNHFAKLEAWLAAGERVFSAKEVRRMREVELEGEEPGRRRIFLSFL